MTTEDPTTDPVTDSVTDSIRRVVSEVADEIEPSTVTAEKEFVADLGVDSLAMIEIVVMLEEEHGLRIPTEAVRTFRRVGDVESYVRGATSASA
ncbi:acyl carrier protein [Nocardioidaceae bacterium]|nr:acyl carrier protein [Nocardioidaceae bacterium]